MLVFFVCLEHKVSMAQNIIFKGILLLQIYIPLHKKNKNTTFAPFCLSKSSNVDGHFSNAMQILTFHEKSAYFSAKKKLKFKHYFFFSTFLTEEMYIFHTRSSKIFVRAFFS